MSEPSPPQEENLGRVGVCIYCGATDDLTDEHVIPKGLDPLYGRAKLYDASCRSCARMTSAFELRVLRHQLGPFRHRLGLHTSHPKRRPTTYPARIRRGDEWQDVELPIDKYTPTAIFPRFPPPGVMVGRAPGAPIPRRFVAIAVVPKDEIGFDPARRAEADEIQQNVVAYPADFMQMLAKIAWGFSVSHYGIDQLIPAILGVIHATDPDPARWIGCSPPEVVLFDGPPTPAYQVSVKAIGPFVIAAIRLFVDRGAPEYMVVVGQLREGVAPSVDGPLAISRP
jgi:hypothetical protein